MQIVQTIEALREALRDARQPVFVPTMGNLHEGHLRLVREAPRWGDCCVVSLFVNRLQFLPHEDFDRYPRTLDDDLRALHSVPCAVAFAPTESDLYPQEQSFRVRPDPGLAEQLEGSFRPGFFEGVATVVMKLFLAVFAGKAQGSAVFGKKDYQQWRVVEAMVRQFALPITIVGIDTVREADGLAMSSRNRFLDPRERRQAPALFAALCAVRNALQAHGLVTTPGHARLKPLSAACEGTIPQAEQGALHAAYQDTILRAEQGALHAAYQDTILRVEQEAFQTLRRAGWDVDYLCVRRRSDLGAPQPGEARVVLGAARLGQTRLIDNLEF